MLGKLISSEGIFPNKTTQEAINRTTAVVHAAAPVTRVNAEQRPPRTRSAQGRRPQHLTLTLRL